MSTITLQLAPETERTLRERAASAGVTIERLLERLAIGMAQEAEEGGAAQPVQTVGVPYFDTRLHLSYDELRQKLRELAAGAPLPTLPPISPVTTSITITTDADSCRHRDSDLEWQRLSADIPASR